MAAESPGRGEQRSKGPFPARSTTLPERSIKKASARTISAIPRDLGTVASPYEPGSPVDCGREDAKHRRVMSGGQVA